MSNIKINSDELKAKASSMREEKKKIDEVLEKFKGDTIKIQTFWSGNTGDMVSERVTKYTNKFDYISNRLEGYILFLEKTAAEYEEEDNLISKKLDGNAEIPANSNPASNS